VTQTATQVVSLMQMIKCNMFSLLYTFYYCFLALLMMN